MIPLAKLRTMVPSLDAMEFQAMLRTIGRTKEQNNVGVYDQLRAGVYELLRSLTIAQDQVKSILTRIAAPLLVLAQSIEANADHLPACMLFIAEGRWVSSTGNDMWYDIVCDSEVEKLPHPATYGVVCDVVAIHLRQQRKAK